MWKKEVKEKWRDGKERGREKSVADPDGILWVPTSLSVQPSFLML